MSYWLPKGVIQFDYVQRDSYCYNVLPNTCFNGVTFTAPHYGRYIFYFVTKTITSEYSTTQLNVHPFTIHEKGKVLSYIMETPYGTEYVFKATIMIDMKEDENVQLENVYKSTMKLEPPFEGGRPRSSTMFTGFWVNADYRQVVEKE